MINPYTETQIANRRGIYPTYYIEKIQLTKKGFKTVIKKKDCDIPYAIIIKDTLKEVIEELQKKKRDLMEYQYGYAREQNTDRDFNF